MNLQLGSVWTNAELKVFDQKIVAARKRGSLAEVDRLREEKEKAATDLGVAARNSLKNNPDFDPRLVDLNNKLSELNYTNHVGRTAILRELGPMLGETSEGKEAASDYSTASGFAQRHGLMLEISWVAMDHLSTGLPALTEWLCDRGCLGIRYEFSGAFPTGPDDEEGEF